MKLLICLFLLIQPAAGLARRADRYESTRARSRLVIIPHWPADAIPRPVWGKPGGSIPRLNTRRAVQHWPLDSGW